MSLEMQPHRPESRNSTPAGINETAGFHASTIGDVQKLNVSTGMPAAFGSASNNFAISDGASTFANTQVAANEQGKYYLDRRMPPGAKPKVVGPGCGASALGVDENGNQRVVVEVKPGKGLCSIGDQGDVYSPDDK